MIQVRSFHFRERKRTKTLENFESIKFSPSIFELKKPFLNTFLGNFFFLSLSSLGFGIWKMSSRKAEERNEKIIRGLMKLPPNRRCINCSSLVLTLFLFTPFSPFLKLEISTIFYNLLSFEINNQWLKLF